MRDFLICFLVCVILAVPAMALEAAHTTAPYSTRSTPDITCSGDTYTNPNMSVIWVSYLSGAGDVYIDGAGAMPAGATSRGGYAGWQFSTSPGLHTVLITKPGYRDFSVKVQVCDKKVTYVNYDRASLVITTATTTVPKTTYTISKGFTLPVTSRQVATIATIQTTDAVQQGSQQQTQQVTQAATTSAQPDTLGSLSVTTTPAGVTIFIDGVKRGASPATIPGLSAGSHTLLLKLDGYEELSTPVIISAGKTQDYSTAMIQNATTGTIPAVTENVTAIPKKAPGFEFVLALAAMGAVFVMRRRS